MPDATNNEPTSEPQTAMTAPGNAPTFPQEQLDRYAALALAAMQLRNYVELNRSQLPADLVGRWNAWYTGLAQVFRGAQTDQVAMRSLLGRLPAYEQELSQYREAFAAHGGPATPSSSATREPKALSPLLLGGGGIVLGLVMGFFLGSGREGPG